MRGGPLGFLLRVGRGGGLGESSVSEDDTSLHCGRILAILSSPNSGMVKLESQENNSLQTT